jgi:dTDP-4-amino-4,6-dideoxygalactose transaminase
MAPKPFEEPIYVTRPLIPALESYTEHLRSIWSKRWFTNEGAIHAALEKALTTYLGVQHIALTSNGTMALLLACKALGLKGEVITTPFTFPATPEILSWCDITPVFVDIDPERLTLDPKAVERAISPRTTGILGVHVYGIPCDVEGIAAIAKQHGLRVLYDGAHAFGTQLNGKSVLEYGDATALSFHATKLFHTAEGGAVVTRDFALKQHIELFRNFGIVDELSVSVPGLNGKLSELHAALGLVNLAIVDAERDARRKIAEIYRARLGHLTGFRCVQPAADVRSSEQYFAIRIDNAAAAITRDHLYETLKTYNVFTRRYFYPLCSEFPFYRELPSSNVENLPVAHRVASEVLCLPFYGSLGPDGAQRVCEIIAYLARQH